MLKGFKNIFNFDAKRLKELEKTAQQVDAYAQQMADLTDIELKNKTTEFRERLATQATLDDILPEAFAVAREAAKRVIGEYPYFVQIMGGIVLHQGDIAEMKTGEGKTLTSVLPVYLNALTGAGVHIVTVNEYLAERDAKWMGQIHEFLGLSVGLNLRQLSPASKRAAYLCDITYTTNAELGFDYLRDNMVTDISQRVLRPLNFTLIDEVDSILIDESRTPLIISGGQKQTANLYLQVDRFVKRLAVDTDYEIDVKSKTVHLTESGVAKAEQTFRVANLYDLQYTNLVHHLNMGLKANYVMAKDVEYVVKERSIVIVDQFTGRLMEGRAYSDGLHQAIEAKEGVPIKEETVTLATITYQNFFRLYRKLAGMTGTAKTEEEEFLSIYNMRVIEIPTNRPVIRDDQTDLVFASKKAKYEALVQKVIECHKNHQPVLVGTISVEVSELISKMLQQRKIRHQVLNAKNHGREADIIARAGHQDSVTIATNMAGRGTDIKLGPGVVELGGLAVLGSERHESRRIDNQLRGRSGRQGDPGFSLFFVSFEDDLMVRYGSDRYQNVISAMGDEVIESKTFTKLIGTAQKRVEGVNFDIRKSLLEYDDVLRQQREIIYEQRDYILTNEEITSLVQEMFQKVIELTVERSENGNGSKYADLQKGLEILGLTGKDFKANTLANYQGDDLLGYLQNKSWEFYERKISDVREQIPEVEKVMVLRVIDRAWVDHIDTMSKLRDGIHLRSYAQTNPLQAYIQEGYELFEEMLQRINLEVVQFGLRLQVRYERQ